MKIAIRESCMVAPAGEPMRPVEVGEVLEVSERDAEILLRLKKATQFGAPPDPTVAAIDDLQPLAPPDLITAKK